MAPDDGTSGDPPPDGKPPDDVIFGLLRVRRRRDVLRYLDENGGEATVGELAEHIAGKEHDVDPDAISSTQRKRVYVSLYQSHLPTFDDADVIEYDAERGRVRLAEASRWVYPYLYFDPAPREVETGTDGGMSSALEPLVRRLFGD